MTDANVIVYNITCVVENVNPFGVWLSLARAPGLGPGGRRFESCHPDYQSMLDHGKRLDNFIRLLHKQWLLMRV